MVADKQLEFIGKGMTVYDMLQKFDKTYLAQFTSSQIICRGKLAEFKVKNYEELLRRVRESSQRVEGSWWKSRRNREKERYRQAITT